VVKKVAYVGMDWQCHLAFTGRIIGGDAALAELGMRAWIFLLCSRLPCC